ncbi:MAG: TlpA family protein disulfide reductase [Bacteroidales bacterium]|nr:TlpA family protein disulfide reductase [Bacteroidales bacterium]
MKQLIFSGFLVGMLWSTMAQNKVEIHGRVANNKEFTRVSLLSVYDDERDTLARAEISPEGHFHLQAPVKRSDLYRLAFSPRQYFVCALHPGDKINVELDAENLTRIVSTSGSSSFNTSKKLADLYLENQNLLNNANNRLRDDKTQQYCSALLQKINDAQQTNKKIDGHVLAMIEQTQQSRQWVNRFTARGKVLPDKGDSLRFMLNNSFKATIDNYRPFKLYMQEVRESHDLTSVNSPNFADINPRIERYHSLADTRQQKAYDVLQNYCETLSSIVSLRDSLTFNGKMDNKTTKEKLTKQMQNAVQQYAESVENIKEDYIKQTDEGNKLSAGIEADLKKNLTTIVQTYQQNFNRESALINDSIKNTLLSNKDDLSVLMFMDYFSQDSHADLQNTLVNALQAKYPDNRIVKEKYEQLHTAKIASSSKNTPAPEIAFNNPEGKLLKLSDLRGKYVLVDFWASWCGPCRRENPHVVNTYAKYHDKGFEVFSVSLDTDKARWQQAIVADKLTWSYHVSDLKGWKSDAARLYGVNSIPCTFLIDKEGNIIAKGLRGEELTRALQSIFGE